MTAAAGGAVNTADEFIYPERHLTITELAEREGVAVQTVKQWRVRGEGPRALRLNSRIVRFPLSEVLRWEQSLMEPEANR